MDLEIIKSKFEIKWYENIKIIVLKVVMWCIKIMDCEYIITHFNNIFKNYLICIHIVLNGHYNN